MSFWSNLKNLGNSGSLAAASQSSQGNVTDIQTHHYSPLPSTHHTRLLEVHPGEGGDVKCSVHTIDLDAPPPYDALSYTWGDHRPPLFQSIASEQGKRHFPIICDGKALYATTNLYHFLLKLRDLDRQAPRADGTVLQNRIWIDAICINQNDISERSSQVAMMDRIYKSASLLIAWLGKSDRYTEPALRLAKYLASIPTEQYPQYMPLRLKHSNITDKDWEALVGLFARPWFRRAWIVQEVVLSARIIVFCGSFEFPWEVLANCSRFLQGTGTWRHLRIHATQFYSISDRLARRTIIPTGIHSTGLAEMRFRISSGSLPSWAIIMVGKAYDATDPRDHIYAMLGLAKEGRRAKPPNDHQSATQLPYPDYSTPTEKVFIEGSRFILEDCKSLLLLSLVEDRLRRSPCFQETLPSWVPDYTVLVQPEPLLLKSPRAPNPTWEASGSQVFESAIIVDDRVLCISGAYFDTIANTGAPLGDLEHNFRWIDVLNFVRQLWQVPVSGTSCADALWRTLVVDCEKPSGKHPADAWLGRAFAEMLVSRLLLMPVVTADPFVAKDYHAATSKLIQGIWDQFRDDPKAFRAETAESRKEIAAQRAQLHRFEMQQIKDRRSQKEEFAVLARTMTAALIEVSQTDSGGIFLKPQEIKQTLGVLKGPDSEAKRQIGRRIDAFQAAAKGIIDARCLILTKGNYLGLAPQSAKEGDMVWILPGTDVPFVLRPVRDHRYTLVGEAYVHGIMHGEAVATGSLEFRDIEIV